MYIMGVTTCIFLGTVNWLPFCMCIGYSNTVFLFMRLLMRSSTFFRFLCLFPSWFRGGICKLLVVAYVATSLPDGTAVLPTLCVHTGCGVLRKHNVLDLSTFF